MTISLRPSLFWDADVQQIDLDAHKSQVIERILMRGRLEEYRAMMQFYGRETVQKVVLEARYLDKYTLAFCCTIFDLPQTAFRCFRLAQLNPEHLDF